MSGDSGCLLPGSVCSGPGSAQELHRHKEGSHFCSPVRDSGQVSTGHPAVPTGWVLAFCTGQLCNRLLRGVQLNLAQGSRRAKGACPGAFRSPQPCGNTGCPALHAHIRHPARCPPPSWPGPGTPRAHTSHRASASRTVRLQRRPRQLQSLGFQHLRISAPASPRHPPRRSALPTDPRAAPRPG